MGGKPEEKPLMESVMENARGFALFLYNKEEGTVLGRTGRGWGEFYFFVSFIHTYIQKKSIHNQTKDLILNEKS